MPLPLKVFINYRRDDRPELVKKIRDGFVIRYGEENVFMDLDIPNYASFPDHLEEKVGVSDVLVACIGPEWLRLLEERANSTKPDYLIREINQALGQRRTMVATICIDGAVVPSEDALPPAIQDMLEFQIPNYQFEEEFLTEIGEVMDDIEREYVRRGLVSRTSMNIERILIQSPHNLEEYLVRQIDEGNLTTIRKHLRDIPVYLIDFAAELSSDQLDDLQALGERFSVFGTTLLVHDQSDLYNLFLQSLKQVCASAYRRLSNESQKCSAIWHEVLKILYFLGALAILEDKPSQLSTLMCSAIELLLLDSKPRHWFQQLQRNRVSTSQVENRLLLDIFRSIKSTDYQYRQFSDDVEVLKGHLCQCDFIHCLFLDLVAETNMSGAWPFFAVEYFESLSPILDTLISDTHYRNELFKAQIGDADLAFAIARYCRINEASNPPFRNIWHQRPWENGIPMHVRHFLRDNLPENNQNFYSCL